MANTFDILNSVLFSKKHIDINVEDVNMYFAFMLNRWISMYSPEMCYFVNETSNINLNQIFETNEEKYDFFYNVMPQIKYKMIKYMKKPEKKKLLVKDEKEAERIKGFADNLELSQREIKEYLENLKYLEK